MSRRKLRSIAAAAIVGGFIAVGAATSFAVAPLPSASSDRDSGQASALGVPGVLTVSESKDTADTDGTWSAVSVADTSLIGGDPAGWTGPLAAAGGVIDSLNAATCDPAGGPLVDQGLTTCLYLLPHGGGGARGGLAEVGAIYNDGSGSRGAIVDVLPSGAVVGSCGGYGQAALLSGITITPDGSQLFDIGTAKSEDNSNCTRR